MVDQMAHRYGMLPSEILAKGTTQDVFVFDAYATYQSYLNEKDRKRSRAQTPVAEPASESLLEKFEKFKKRQEK